MKRVLNSGTIRLPQIKKDLRYLDQYVDAAVKDSNFDNLLDYQLLENWTFVFEIKAPILTFLAFQDSNLGTLKRLGEQDRQIAYLPPYFYKKDGTTFIKLEDKQMNIYNTKLFNFFSAAFNFYNKLIEEGMCKEQAELVIPAGLFINFLWEINVRDLIMYIEDHYNDSPEIFGYCSVLMIYLEEHLPNLVRWLRARRWHDLGI
ncbi:MAG: FAD-dependent thymidylate synthase [bacterium]